MPKSQVPKVFGFFMEKNTKQQAMQNAMIEWRKEAIAKVKAAGARIGKAPKNYVEVKPVTTFPEDVADKISNSGCCNELLILGSTCIIPNEDDFVFGWLGQDYSEGGIETMHVFGNAVLLRLDESKGKIGFCHQDASWQDRITGLYDGSIYCDFTKREIKELWGLAHNKTRWSKK